MVEKEFPSKESQDHYQASSWQQVGREKNNDFCCFEIVMLWAGLMGASYQSAAHIFRPCAFKADNCDQRQKLLPRNMLMVIIRWKVRAVISVPHLSFM